MGSCYFFAGALLLWQQIQSARDPAVGDERRAGAVIWAQQGQPPSSTPSRSQGGATGPGPICCRRGRSAAVLGRVGRHNSRGQHPSAGPGLCHQAGKQQTAPGSTRGRTSASARRSQASARPAASRIPSLASRSSRRRRLASAWSIRCHKFAEVCSSRRWHIQVTSASQRASAMVAAWGSCSALRT